jgi:glycosyltransferase involved in cell wall biosynthesis
VTVKQAVSAKQYSVAKLDKKLIDEAIETQRRIFENCDAIFVTSEWVKKSVQSDYGIDADSIYVVGVGSTNHFDLRQGEKITNHKILFVGRDWQRKGGSVLIEAFERVRKVIKDAQLTIIGCKPDIRCEAVTVLGELSQSNPEQGRIL